MESIAEVVIVCEKRVCSSCKVLKGEGFFVKCACVAGSFWKTCKTCRDTKTKYRERVKASKVIVVVDDAVSVSSSSSATPADYFGPAPLSSTITFSYPKGSEFIR